MAFDPLRLLRPSRPSTRRLVPALVGGVLGGVAGGLVKAKWEQVYPPRPEDRTAPPEILLERAGIDPEDGSAVEQAGPPAIHYAFSVTAATAYAVSSELVPGIRFAKGIPYGLGMWAAFHLGLLPGLGTAPGPTEQPRQEIWGEASGHVFYILTVEGVRWAVRSVLTGGAPEAAPAR